MCVGMLTVIADFMGAIGSGTGILLAVTTSGGHGMVWPSGLKAQRAWACEVAVEWARATVQSEAN